MLDQKEDIPPTVSLGLIYDVIAFDTIPPLFAVTHVYKQYYEVLY